MMGGRLCVAYRIKGNDEVRDSPSVRDSPNKPVEVHGRILYGKVCSGQWVFSIILKLLIFLICSFFS